MRTGPDKGTGQLGHGLGPAVLGAPRKAKLKKCVGIDSYSLSHEKTEKNVLDCYLFYVSACVY